MLTIACTILRSQLLTCGGTVVRILVGDVDSFSRTRVGKKFTLNKIKTPVMFLHYV